jgi:HlyD family secretion protein
MRRALWLAVVPVLGLVAALVLPGCGAKEEAKRESVTEPLAVQRLEPKLCTIKRIVGQPSFVVPYERTSIYPKVTGYIRPWLADIGDKVRKDQPLAKIFAPEYNEDWETKKRKVAYDWERIQFANEQVDVATANVKAAEEAVNEAIAILGKFEAEVFRWDSEVKRLTREVERGVVDPQVLLESENQWKSSIAARDAARADIEKKRADLISAKATLRKDEVAVRVAKEDWRVAQSEERWAKVWVDYLDLKAPYDGVVVGRNANSDDFVLPSKGDPTAVHRSPYLAPGNSAAPIYVVDRTDIVRIFVDIPEGDADYVHGEDALLEQAAAKNGKLKGDDLLKWLSDPSQKRMGTPALVQVKAYKDTWLPATVTRTAWALNETSRTLRAEIDMLNPGGKILPGMYAYAKVIVTRPNVLAVPVEALTHYGDQSYFWLFRDGKATRTEVQTGVTGTAYQPDAAGKMRALGGTWIEVTNVKAPHDAKLIPKDNKPEDDLLTLNEDSWRPIDAKDQVILGDLSILTEGCLVKAAGGTEEGKIASTVPAGKNPKDKRVE